jgi:hypothetical protein
MIKRVKISSEEVFKNNYLFQHKPVIISNLFDHELLGSLRTIQEVKRELGGLKIQVRTTEGFSEQPWSLSDFLEFVEENPDEQLYINHKIFYKPNTEHVSLLNFPLQCFSNCQDETVSFLIGANAGFIVHLHFDVDHRDILLYQISGKKRIIVIPPYESRKLDPILNFSKFALNKLSYEEMTSLLNSTDAQICELNPGECIFIPMMYWHYVDYIDTAISLAFRLPRNPFNKFLANHVHSDINLQSIAIRMYDEGLAKQKYMKQFHIIKYECEKYFERSFDKYLHMSEVLRRARMEIDEIELDLKTLSLYDSSSTYELVEMNEAFRKAAIRPYSFMNWMKLHGLINTPLYKHCHSKIIS